MSAYRLPHEAPQQGSSQEPMLAMPIGPLGKRIINSGHISKDTLLLQMLRDGLGTNWEAFPIIICPDQSGVTALRE